MKVDEKIVALRGDRTLQHRSTQRMESARAQWLAGELPRLIEAEIGRLASSEAMEQLPHLRRLLGEFETASGFVEGFLASFVDGLRDEPLGLVPCSHSCQDGLTIVRLFSHGGVDLSLIAYANRREGDPPTSTIFADRWVREIVIAGKGTALLHRLGQSSSGDCSISSRTIRLGPGSKLDLPDHCSSRQIVGAEAGLVVLQLSCTPDWPRPTREHCLADGRMLRQACGSKAVSQQEIALAVLGALKRKDAVPAMAALAVEGPPHLRWEAIRHTIALEPLAGVRTLTETAAREGDELALPAAQLRAQLFATCPQFAELDASACRA